MCSRMKKGIDFSEDKNYFNDIKEVGPGGHYLIAVSTVLACRSDEFFQGELLDKNTYESEVTLSILNSYIEDSEVNLDKATIKKMVG